MEAAAVEEGGRSGPTGCRKVGEEVLVVDVHGTDLTLVFLLEEQLGLWAKILSEGMQPMEIREVLREGCYWLGRGGGEEVHFKVTSTPRKAQQRTGLGKVDGPAHSVRVHGARADRISAACSCMSCRRRRSWDRRRSGVALVLAAAASAAAAAVAGTATTPAAAASSPATSPATSPAATTTTCTSCSCTTPASAAAAACRGGGETGSDQQQRRG